jgi:hypothetical protein
MVSKGDDHLAFSSFPKRQLNFSTFPYVDHLYMLEVCADLPKFCKDPLNESKRCDNYIKGILLNFVYAASLE